MDLNLNLLLASVFGLTLGPFLLRMNLEQEGRAKAIDSFALVAVGGLVVLHLIPDVLAHGGLLSALFVLIGGVLPAMLHRHDGHNSKKVSAIVLLVGLAPHIALESAALGVADADHVWALGAAIIIHRLPVGLVVFVHLRGPGGGSRGWVAIGLLVAFAVLGFVLGDGLQDSFSEEAFAHLQALAAGMLLHVLFTHPLGEKQEGHQHTHAHSHSTGECEHTSATRTEKSCHAEPTPANSCHSAPATPSEDHCHGETQGIDAWSTAGALLGAVAVAATLVLGGGHAHGEEVHGVGNTFLSLALQSAPALLIAYVLAGLLTAFVTPARLQWLSGGSVGTQALKGVGFGLPLPICSCGVLPLYETLVKRGVPGTAAVAFLVATPELGLDAVLLSIPLLGAELTMARVLAAFLVATVVALLVGRAIGASRLPVDHEEAQPAESMGSRIRSGLRFGLIELFDSTMPWVLAGLLIAAWVEPVLGATSIHTVSPYIQVPLFALIGIPLYVCAAGATPIAAVAIMGGVSPGAGIAFLLAGPATNITTFGILSRLHNKRAALIFGLAMTVGAIGAGLSVDLAGVTFGGESHGGGHAHGDAAHGGSIIELLSLGGLAMLLGWSLLRKGPRGIVAQIGQPSSSH